MFICDVASDEWRKMLGMIYGDYSEPHTSLPPGLSEGNMKEWRNHLVQALQSGNKKIHEG